MTCTDVSVSKGIVFRKLEDNERERERERERDREREREREKRCGIKKFYYLLFIIYFRFTH